jgi:hypothetical protein
VVWRILLIVYLLALGGLLWFLRRSRRYFN